MMMMMMKINGGKRARSSHVPFLPFHVAPVVAARAATIRDRAQARPDVNRPGRLPQAAWLGMIMATSATSHLMSNRLSPIAERLFAPTSQALAVWAVVVFFGSLGLFLWGVDRGARHLFRRDLVRRDGAHAAQDGRDAAPGTSAARQAADRLQHADFRRRSARLARDERCVRRADARSRSSLWSFALLRDVGQALWASARHRSSTSSFMCKRASPCSTSS